jgi:hypothetical protein
VRIYLEKQRFTDIKTKNTRQHGIDLEAIAPDSQTRLYVEAKGEKSSKPKTARYKTGFDTGQKKDHLGKQLLWTCQMLARKFDYPVRIGIALPNDDKNSELIKEIEPVLKKLRITAFLAENDGKVIIKGTQL